MAVFDWVEKTRVRSIIEDINRLSTSTEDQVSFFIFENLMKKTNGATLLLAS